MKAALKRQPYRLSARTPLTPEPPFNPEFTRELLLAAMYGLKRVQLDLREPFDDRTVNKLSATLNARHAMFVAAQEERAHAARCDRATVLIAELRGLLPIILANLERSTDDFFSRATKTAAGKLYEAIASDQVKTALPKMTLSENVSSWQWCGRSLYDDIAPLIGSNAAIRFLAAAIPLLSGEHPQAGAIATWIKQQKRAA